MSTRGRHFPDPIRPLFGALIALAVGVSSASAQARTAADSVRYLPHDFVMAQVGDTTITVRTYLDRWFNTWPEDRPGPDSTGRVQFLNTLVNRQLLANATRRGNMTLPFEQRNQLRAYRNHILSYVLRVRTVDDSVQITPEEMERIRAAARLEYRYQFVVFEDVAMATFARRDLMAKQTLDQVRRQYVTVTQEWDENLWISTHKLHPQHTAVLALLEPGQVSKPFMVPGGAALIRPLERRPTKQVASNSQVVASFLRSMRTEDRTEEVMSSLRAHAHVVYDTTNLRWLAAKFQGSARPRIAPADTGRVLATAPNRRFSVGAYMHDYLERPPVLRPEVNNPDLLRRAVDDLILEPAKVSLAESRGIDKDPMAVNLIEDKREGLLIELFFRDSVQAKVFSTPAERKRYYDRNLTKYLTYATAHYVVLRGPTVTEANLLARRIRAGEKAADLVGEVTGGVKRVGRVGELRENEQDPYHDILFQELRPGELKVFGPDENEEFFVLQLTSFDAGRQLSYEEAESYLDEAVRNGKAEELLQKILEREKRAIKLDLQAARVMQIELKDPWY